MKKIVKIYKGANLAMIEHAKSLFYDKERNSSFYFNFEYEEHYVKLVQQFINIIPDINDKPLQPQKYEWFKRQCKMPDETINLDTINVHTLHFGGLKWSAFYSCADFHNEMVFVIWHFSYQH